MARTSAERSALKRARSSTPEPVEQFCECCGREIVEASESGSEEPDHEQVWVRPFWLDEDIQVDKGISDVLQAFWALGIATSNSCEDNFGKIWVQCHLCTYRRFMDDVLYSAHEDECLRKSLAWFLGAVELSLYPDHADYGDNGMTFICLRVPVGDKARLLEFVELARGEHPAEERPQKRRKAQKRAQEAAASAA